MKLHLPVKLRASLIAAVIAVSASVYNAYAANIYNEFGNNDHVFTSATPGVNGNEYIAVSATKTYYYVDNTKAQELELGTDGVTWYHKGTDTVYTPADNAWGPYTETATDDGKLTFQVSSPKQGTRDYITEFEGGTSLKADYIQFNNTVESVDGGAAPTTITAEQAIEVNSRPIAGYSNVALENVTINTPATKISGDSELNIDNTAAADNALNLGAVSGKGSLYVTGSNVATMDGINLESLGNLGLTNTTADIDGLVAVNDLKLVNSTAEVDGNVTFGGTVNIDKDSVIEATGDIASRTSTGTGNVAAIDGRIESTDGDIILDNCRNGINGEIIASSTTAGKGNISLNNVAVNDGATISATGDLTLSSNSTIIDTDERDITVNAGGDLTVEDGSEVDNVYAEVGGAITVDGATVTDSYLDGATGDITLINGSDLSGTVIDGGRHLKLDETQATVNLDGTKIINLTGDIKLSKVDRTGLNLATQGTSPDNVTDYDAHVGGSIIITESTIANSTIKSGVKTDIAADGTLSYSDVASPYGNIAVATSKLTNSEITTKRGNVTLTGGTVAGETAPLGTRNDNCGGITGFKTTLSKLGLSATMPKLTSISVMERDGNGTQPTNVSLRIKNAAGDVLATSTNKVNFGNSAAYKQFTFDPIVLDSATEYTFEFINDQGNVVSAQLGLMKNSPNMVQVTGQTLANHTALVQAGYSDYTTDILGSSISTDGGTLNMSGTYTAAANGKDTNINIKATDKGRIVNSMLNGGTNVKVTGNNLYVEGSYLLDDVNLDVSGEYDIKGETVINIDGGDAHDASLRAGTNLWADIDESVAGDTINIKNADVQIGGRIEMFGDSTMNLTNVYKDQDGNKTASDLGRVKTRNGSGRGTLNITGSIIDAEAIWSNSYDNQNYAAENGTSLDKYFANVNVVDSEVKVTGKALIENLSITNDSEVAILGGAYLDTTTIDGTSKLTTGGASKLDDVNIADGGTIRVTNTGAGVTTLANLNRDADTNGTVNVEVVNATLQTPVVDNRVVLGLSGGTLHIKSVAAHGNALAASDAPVVDPASLILTPEVNPHVVLSAVTDAGISTPAAGSTIKTDGLHRFQSFASSSEGTPATATNLYRYLYTVSADHTVAAGETLWVKDANGVWTLAAEGDVLAAGTEVSKLNYTVTDAEVQYDGTVADPNLSAVTEIIPTLSLEEQAYLEPQKVTTWAENVTPVQVGTETVDGVLVTYYQKVEKMDDIPYIDGYFKNPGSVVVSNDGIASLTVEGDFGAHNTTINAYKLATPVAFWLEGRELTIDQFKALSDADKAACTPEYKESATVHYTIIDGTAFDALAATDLSYADKSVYTKLNPKTYTATGVSTLSVADYEKLDGDAGQAAYVAVPGYISKTDSSVTITTAQYNALSDAEKADYEEGTIAWTNRVVKTQAEFNALTDAEKAEYTQIGSEFVKINTVTIKTCVMETLSADGQLAFVEDRRYFTTITAAAYASLTDAQKNAWEALVDWTAQDITSLRDGGYNGIFVDKNFLLDDTCCQDKGISSEMVKSDETGHIKIVGALKGNDNKLNADTTIEIGSITGSGNVLNAPGAIETGAITGSGNDLFSAEDITTGAIGGNDNVLFTSESITTGAITGSGNELTAGTTLNVESIGGNENVLSADESITTGAITGSGNELEANGDVTVNGEVAGGNTITSATGNIGTGAINGNGNTLTATEGTITTNAITGNGNELTGGVVTVNGKLYGSNNTLTAEAGDVTLKSSGGQSIEGSGNTITATGNVNIEDNVKGSNNTIKGTSILSHVQNGNVWAGIEGDSNQLLADAEILMDTITGSSNNLEAGTSIKVGAITGSNNELEAGTSITSGAIKGSNNTLVANDGDISLDYVWNAASNGYASIVGSNNTIDATGTVTVKDDIVGDNNMIGGENIISHGGDDPWASLKGSENQLQASDTIRMDTVEGNKNELSSGSLIKLDGLSGDENELISDTITIGAISAGSDSNTLRADTITTGAITGDRNELEAETITTGGINGTANKLVGLTVKVNGKLEGSANKVTATNIHVDEVAGTAQEIVSKGVETAAKVAIDIDKLTGTNAIIEVQYPGKGSINIDSMTAQTGAGDTGTTITTLAGNVTIGTMNNATAKTAINVGTSYGITVGSGSASNQTWTASSLSITGTEGVTLTDSTVTILGAVDATKLTLTGETTLAATGNVKAGTLTLDGPDALVNATKLTVTDMLELKGNASLDSVKVTTDGSATLKVTNSVLTTGMLDGFTGIELENSTGNLGGAALGTAAKPMTSVVATGSELTASSIYTTGVVKADDSEITITNDITAQSMIIDRGGEIKADDVTLSGELDADGGTLKAESVTGATIATLNGATIDGALSMATTSTSANVTAENGTKIGSIANADAVTLTASSVTGDVGMNGALNMGAEATIGGKVTGATSATLDNADITGTLGMNGALSMTDASTGAVTGATSATLTDSIITGALGMNGELNMTNASTGKVTGATNATLDNANIDGNLGMGGELNMTNASAGSVTGATDATLDNANIDGNLGMGGELNMTAASAGSVTGATDATLTNANIDGALNASGTVVVDGGSIGSITGSATKVDLDNVESIGSITMSTNGTLNVTDTVTGAVNAANGNTVANATLIDSMIGSGLNVTGTLDVIGDAGVAGNVTAGNLNVSDGTLYATDGNTLYDVTVNNKTTLSNGEVVAGTFTTKELELVDMAGEVEKLIADGNVAMAGTTLDVTKTDADAVKVGGNMTLTQGAILSNAGGAQITGDLKVDGSAFTNDGAVQAGSIAVKDGGVLTGTTVTANGVTVTSGGTLAGVVNSTGAVTVTNGMITGAVTGEGVSVSGGEIAGNVTVSQDAVTVSKAGTIAGSVDKASTVTLSGASSILGSVTNATGKVTLGGGSTIGGSVTTLGDVEISGASSAITGKVTADDVTVTDGGSIGNGVNAEGNVLVSNGDITGDVAASGNVTVTNNAHITGNVTTTTNGATVTVNGASIKGNVESNGDLTVNKGTITGGVLAQKGTTKLDAATITNGLTAGSTTVTNAVEVGSADVTDLTVGTDSTLTAANGVTADGKLDIKGDVLAKSGDISLKGAEGSIIAGSKVTATAGTVTIDGEVAAAAVVLKGNNVNIDGTLAAGKGVSFIGTVGGAGTIVKTGGDKLALAGDTAIGGVTVIDSKLDAGDGAKLGKLQLAGSTMQIAGEDSLGRVFVDGGSIDSTSTVVADVKLGQRAGSDVIESTGTVSIADGATVVLNDLGTIETNVADQQSVSIIEGNVSGNFEVEHGYDTLNVHSEGGDLVFSKNFKGAENKTENQTATADALASITEAKAELGSVMDALNHTRSEADALKALDSLSGAGLAVAPKLVADETKEHLQTLRSSLQSVAAGLNRRYDAAGVRHAEIESTGVTAAVTGGSATVNADGNAEEYSRSSMGAMFTVAHAINDEWTFGAAISFSQSDADCGNTTIDAQGVFVDVGVMQKRGRFAQMGSIGCAFFSMDTERTVGVNAPGYAFGGTAEGTTDASAFTMTYETTYAIWKTESYSFSSVVMAEMLFAQVDNMEEKGLGNAGLRSSYDDVASFTFGVGARYTYTFGQESNPGYISAEAMFVADTGDSTTKVNNAFIGGGNSFQLSGPEAGNYGLRLNAGVLLPIGDQWGLFGNVTSEIRTEQTTVGGSVGVKCTF